MNVNQLYALESLFGPPSEKIDVPHFLDSTATLFQTHSDKEIFDAEIIDECSVSDIQKTLKDTWDDPVLSAHLLKVHDHTVHVLDNTVNQKSTKSNRKVAIPDPDATEAELRLKKVLSDVSLRSFRLKTDAAPFMRTPKNSDKNILRSVKCGTAGSVGGTREVVITMSIYNKVTWAPSYVARSSQHIFLSSQTLHDVLDTFPCVSKTLPSEAGTSGKDTDCFVCIEGCVYGSQPTGDGYAAKLVELLSRKGTSPISRATSSVTHTQLRSLSMRINEPYWLVHAGNCEHFLVVDQIRLYHPVDPVSGYPLTVQITPPILDLCRACGKVPALWSIIGDVRLGETPCLMCGPCWKSMGESDEATVLPLAEHSYI